MHFEVSPMKTRPVEAPVLRLPAPCSVSVMPAGTVRAPLLPVTVSEPEMVMGKWDANAAEVVRLPSICALAPPVVVSARLFWQQHARRQETDAAYSKATLV